MKHPFGNDPAKVEGYRKFWRREPVKRPLVGFSLKSWFPLDEFKASAAWPKDGRLTVDMLKPAEFMDDQERLLVEGEWAGDDILRGASPSQAIFWAEGSLGSSMRVLPGNVVAEEQHVDWEAALAKKLDRGAPWFKNYIEFIDVLVKRAAGRFPVSHGTLCGPLDLAVNLRGHEQTIIDLMEEPDKAVRLLDNMTDFFIQITKEAWKRIPRWGGGWFDAQYSLWSPGPIVRMQEDAVAVVSPDLYERYIKPMDLKVAREFESCFMHLHATSMFVLDKILAIEPLKCLEINNDVGGPPVSWLVPHLSKVQKAGRSLVVRGSFTPDELKLMLDSLEPAGLFLYIMVADRKELDLLRPILGM